MPLPPYNVSSTIVYVAFDPVFSLAAWWFIIAIQSLIVAGVTWGFYAALTVKPKGE